MRIFSLCLGLCLPVFAQLSFEAETCIVNPDACTKDKFSDKTWNIWSTDKDAMKKWSGGVVVQSPVVKADRKSPEEGAPPLHLRVTGIPAGIYNVSATGPGRVAGLSLDGKNWSRFSGGLVARNVKIEQGTFEFWFDDLYAMEKEEQRGSTYLDRIVLDRVLGIENGVGNPGFEQADGEQALGWSWWSRENKGSAKIVDQAHGGRNAVRILHDGEKDWNLSCGTHLAVETDQEYAVRAWVKCTDTKAAGVAVVGCKDGKPVNWSVGEARTSGTHDWKEIKGYAHIPRGVDSVYVRVVGSGPADFLVDDISLKPEKMTYEQKPKVEGWLRKRPVERFERALVALPTAQGVYLSWRLLAEDPETVAFDVFRIDGKRRQQLNQAPILRTTDFLDAGKDAAPDSVYQVVPRSGSGPSGEATLATAGAGGDALPYVSIKLKDPKTSFMIVGTVDLDGDGRLDYVMKHPSANIDPWEKYWYKSPETYKIEAYRHDGTCLWTHDLGWAIERGIWYSPWIAVDLDGDGKAEIAAKVGEGDPRDEDGRVTSGPEWVAVWKRPDRRGDLPRALAGAERLPELQPGLAQSDRRRLPGRQDSLPARPARHLQPHDRRCLPVPQGAARETLALRQPGVRAPLLGPGRPLHALPRHRRRRPRRGHPRQRRDRRQRRAALEHRQGASRRRDPRRFRPDQARPRDRLRDRDAQPDRRRLPGRRPHRQTPLGTPGTHQARPRQGHLHGHRPRACRTRVLRGRCRRAHAHRTPLAVCGQRHAARLRSPTCPSASARPPAGGMRTCSRNSSAGA